MRLLLLSALAVARAVPSEFGCSPASSVPCEYTIGEWKRSIYASLTRDRPIRARFFAQRPVDVRIVFPLPYSQTQVSITARNATVLVSPSVSSRLDPYLQAAEFWYSAVSISSGEAELQVETTLPRAKLRFDVSGRSRTTALELLSLPITLFRVHGEDWTDQLYVWVYASLAFSLATLYLLFARCRVWQSFLLYGAAAFSAIACEKLQHAVNAFSNVSDPDRFTLSFCVVILLIEGLPALFCMSLLRFSKWKPLPFAFLGVCIAVVSLFTGGGWYAGPFLVSIGCLAVLSVRYL